MAVRIEHVALWADDLDTMAAFYVSHFGAQVGPAYRNATKGFSSRFLRFEDGTRIELMHSDTLALPRIEPGAQRMGLTHLAISVGSDADVDALTRSLAQAGTPVLDGPRRTGDGYYESVVLDPEGNRIEITS